VPKVVASLRSVVFINAGYYQNEIEYMYIRLDVSFF